MQTEGNLSIAALSSSVMLARTTLALSAGLGALLCACSPKTASSPVPILPLRTLRLYETGVGYFERSGDLRAAATSLPVPAGHLDDALKTLVVLNRGGKGTVHGIEFGSSISRGMARALAGLPVDGDEPLGWQQLLVGLKGARVETRARGGRGTRNGRIVDVVAATEDGISSKEDSASETPRDASKASAEPKKTLTVVLLTDAGALVRIATTDLDSVRPLDPTWAARLGSSLDAVSTRGAQSERLLHVLAGGGGGDVTLGYVAETPVWRTTYRVVMDGTRTAGILEGWALLHNDTDEDWRGVRVELANGRPDSFLFPLAAPRYARRALVTPDDQLATVPQLMGTTVDAIWGDQLGDSFGIGAVSGVGEGGGGSGYGYGHGRLGGSATRSAEDGSPLLAVGNLASTAPATGVEAGALFVYSLAERVDLEAHHSALVPFAHERIDAVPIAWVESPGTPARVGVRLVNSTTRTLPAGTVAFFGEGGFAGESLLSRLKPGQRSFLTYGLDLDVELDRGETRASEAPKRLVWDKAARVLQEHYLRTSDSTFSIENRSAHTRSVVLTMPLDRNATLTGPDVVDFDLATSRPLAVFAVDPQRKVERKTHAVEGLMRRTDFAALTSTRLNEIASSVSLDAGDRAAAAEAATRLHEAEGNDATAAQVKGDIEEVEKDLDRLREHMKALAGDRAAGGAAGNPFAARVLVAEDRLASLRKKLDHVEADAKAKKEAAIAALVRLHPPAGD
jgi:hypothetical protein